MMIYFISKDQVEHGISLLQRDPRAHSPIKTHRDVHVVEKMVKCILGKSMIFYFHVAWPERETTLAPSRSPMIRVLADLGRKAFLYDQDNLQRVLYDPLLSCLFV